MASVFVKDSTHGQILPPPVVTSVILKIHFSNCKLSNMRETKFKMQVIMMQINNYLAI